MGKRNRDRGYDIAYRVSTKTISLVAVVGLASPRDNRSGIDPDLQHLQRGIQRKYAIEDLPETIRSKAYQGPTATR